MRSQYQKESVALSHIDPLLAERYFMMFGSDPQSFKEVFHDPIWQESMDEDFDLLHDNQLGTCLLTSRKEDGTMQMDLQNQNSC